MFRDAYKQAAEFTLPLIISTKKNNGKCESGIGAFVPVNKDGWAVTASHIVTGVGAVNAMVVRERQREGEVEKIRSDASLSAKEKSKKLAALGKPNGDHVCRVSLWFGGGRPTKITQVHVIQAADLALIKLDPWRPDWVSAYPTFKDPSKDFDPGTSLCTLGFPFHHFEPSYDEATDNFILPPEALPVPRFPINGMFTRTTNIIGVGQPPAFPLKWIETSSPGLKGQSGGPIFDRHGTIWAIQANTLPIYLGFDGSVPRTKVRVPQFLNIGRGVHAETILGLLRQHKVDFQMSTY